MTDITDEQLAAVAWLHEIEAKTDGQNVRNHVRLLLDALPSDLTNPQPVLPTQPGIYADTDGSPWHVEDGRWWFGNTDRYPNSNAEDAKHITSFAPFTRLVPEREPITREQVSRAVADVAQQFGLPVHTANYISALTSALANGTDRD